MLQYCTTLWFSVWKFPPTESWEPVIIVFVPRDQVQYGCRSGESWGRSPHLSQDHSHLYSSKTSTSRGVGSCSEYQFAERLLWPALLFDAWEETSSIFCFSARRWFWGLWGSLLPVAWEEPLLHSGLRSIHRGVPCPRPRWPSWSWRGVRRKTTVLGRPSLVWSFWIPDYWRKDDLPILHVTMDIPGRQFCSVIYCYQLARLKRSLALVRSRN